MPPELIDVLLIALKVIGVVVVINGLILLFMWRVGAYKRNIERQKNSPGYKDELALRRQKKQDDRILEEADRFYGAPW